MAKINYKLWDGSRREIEVAEDFAMAYEKMEKLEIKLERKETRRHISLDEYLDKIQNLSNKIDIESRLVKVCCDRYEKDESTLDPLEILIRREEYENNPRLKQLLSLGLTEYQLRIAESFYIENKNQSQIARENRVSRVAICNLIKKIKNKVGS